MTTQPTLAPGAFAAKWRGVTTTEKAASQEHFIDLCRMLGEPTPHEADPIGAQYAFEKRVSKAAGGDGFADVWKHDFFAWEYKGKAKDLRAAYVQLMGYKDDLGNPPLLVVSDLERIEIHTNFTGLSPVVKLVTLDDLAADDPSDALATLRAVFTAPEELRPRVQPAQITEQAARHFAEIAQSLRSRGHDPADVAHFLDRILFCLFAEDAGLLPKGIFERLSGASHGRSSIFTTALGELFAKMARDGGLFGTEEIDWFNGGLFDSAEVLPLVGSEITTLLEVSRLNWALIEPAIFGTLFERGLDPGQRAQLGAHYTDREAIWGLVEPVILRPLRREYAAMQARVTELLMAGRKATKATPRADNPEAVFEDFLERLRRVRVLDPACGSGNFLIVSLWALKDLEFEAIHWGSLVLERPMQVPQIGPEAVLGIEINAYAAELARVTIWIGEIQWMIRHGLGYRRDPILRPLHHIETRDALLDLSDPANPREAEWPEAEFIVGNPPFLGGKWMRRGLGDYVRGRPLRGLRPTGSRAKPTSSPTGTRRPEPRSSKAEPTEQASWPISRSAPAPADEFSSASRRPVEIFFARSDEPWVLAGASVHISFVGQDDGSEAGARARWRTGRRHSIRTSRRASTSPRSAPLVANTGWSFMGDTKGGPFEIDRRQSRARFSPRRTPMADPTHDVVRPWLNGEDLNGRSRDMWIVDFGVDMREAEAALYEAPFEYVLRARAPRAPQEPSRRRTPSAGGSTSSRGPGSEPRQPTSAATSRRHRSRRTASSRGCPPARCPTVGSLHSRTIDDYIFGVLHSRAHELWSRNTAGAQRREAISGFTYTPTTCFETFPFPDPTPEQRERVGEAARRLVELRDGWLNPPGLDPADLAKRTLTNLYNQRPTWLANAHADLDAAVFAAYGWPGDVSDSEILERLLALNRGRAR